MAAAPADILAADLWTARVEHVLGALFDSELNGVTYCIVIKLTWSRLSNKSSQCGKGRTVLLAVNTAESRTGLQLEAAEEISEIVFKLFIE
jgi:hypothetical protein